MNTIRTFNSPFKKTATKYGMSNTHIIEQVLFQCRILIEKLTWNTFRITV